MDESASKDDELPAAGDIPSSDDEHSISTESDESDCWSQLSKNNIWNPARGHSRRTAFYSKIEEYRAKGTYTDVNIVCDGGTFRCHRLALATASEYFHKIFAENPREQDVDLSDTIHRDLFEQILVYVYRGEVVPIHDGNVSSLLEASDIFGLGDIEDHCIHYLTQKNIPEDDALEIYYHALESHKVSLIPAVCKYMLENLHVFGSRRAFLEMDLKPFSTLLEYFQSPFKGAEILLLQVIFEWVFRRTDSVREKRLSHFTEFAKKAQFRTISTANVVEYFESNSVDRDEFVRRPIPRLHRRIIVPGLDAALLNVYIGTIDGGKECSNILNESSATHTNIFSLQEYRSGRDGNWSYSCTLSPAILKMRIVESGDRLYSLTLSEGWWTFNSNTAIDLVTGTQVLEPPSGLLLTEHQSVFTECDHDDRTVPFSLCRLREKIYLCGLHEKIGLQCYDTELNTWSRIRGLSEYEPINTIITDDTRLYMIHKRPSSRSFHFSAYDPREGKAQKLRNKGLRYLKWCDEPCSYLKGKIYLPEYDVGYSTNGSALRMAVYDPILGQWEVENSKFRNEKFTHGHRIVPFNGRLWMFGLVGDGVVYAKTYDPYVQKWSNQCITKLHSALEELQSYPRAIQDAVAF